MRRLFTLAVLATVLGSPALARASTVTEFPTPVDKAGPSGLTSARDGAIWYGGGADSVQLSFGRPHFGRIDPRTLRVEIVPVRVRPSDLVYVPGDEAIWATVFADEGSVLYRVDPATRAVREFPVAEAFYSKLTATVDGRLFALRKGAIEQIDLATGTGRVVARPREPEPYPTAGGRTAFRTFTFDDLAAAPNGALWTAERSAGGVNMDQTAQLARVDPVTGEQRRLPELPPNTVVSSLAAGPGDEVWAGAYQLSGGFRGPGSPPMAQPVYHGTSAAGPVETIGGIFGDNAIRDLTFGPDRRLWFTLDNRIGRLDLAARTASFDVAPSSSNLLGSLTAGQGATMWLSQIDNNNMVRIGIEGAGDTANTDTVIDKGFTALVGCRTACKGTTALEVSRRASSTRATASRARKLTVAKGSFALDAAGQRSVSLKIAARARKLLRAGKRVRVTQRTRTRTGGRTRTSQRTLIFRRYKAPKGR